MVFCMRGSTRLQLEGRHGVSPIRRQPELEFPVATLGYVLLSVHFFLISIGINCPSPYIWNEIHLLLSDVRCVSQFVKTSRNSRVPSTRVFFVVLAEIRLA